MIDTSKLVDEKYYVIFLDPYSPAEEPSLVVYRDGCLENDLGIWNIEDAQEIRGPVDWKSLPLITKASDQ